METYKETVTLPLECRLTDKEHKEASKQLSENIMTRNRIEDEIATFKAQKKAEIESIESQINVLTPQVNSEKTIRPVECEIRFDFAKGVKTTFRKDTGAEVTSAKITDAERQQHLDLEKGSKKAPPVPAGRR